MMVSLKSSRRAQAAMEFLMTYGWAILVVLIVIGALAYFGVLNPSTVLPEKCTFPVSISCSDFGVGGSTITLNLLNGAGRDMNVYNVSASSEALGTGSLGCGCTTAAFVGNTFQFRNGLTSTFTLNTADAACVGACAFKDTGRDKNRYNLSIRYAWTDSPSIIHTLTGELLARKP